MLTETGTLITRVGELIQSLITIVGALALLVFMWGLVKFIFSQGNETAKTEGKKVMVWGLIALFVMVSVWGIIGFIQSDLGLPVTTQSGQTTRPLSDGCGPRSQGYAVECDNQFEDF